MNVPVLDILDQLHDVELGSLLADIDNVPEEERRGNRSKAAQALVTIKNFIASFGVTVLSVFEQDRNQGTQPTPAKDQGKGKSKTLTTEQSADENKETPSFESTGVRSKDEDKPPSSPTAKESEKKEKALAPSKNDEAEEDDDNNPDMQAALLASRQAPTSPPGDSGAQSSTPKRTEGPAVEEERIVKQISNLMTELVDLETRPTTTTVEKCRMDSIHNVLDNLQSELQEIESQKLSAQTTTSQKVKEKDEQASKGQPQPSERQAL